MSNRPGPIDRFTAEQLLRGEAAGADQAPEALATTLAAAAAPARGVERAGEDAALGAFRDARLAPSPQLSPQLRRQSMIKTAMAKFLTLKVGAVALTATATCAGGVALAASTGNLPGNLDGKTPGAGHKHGHHTGVPHPGKTPLPGVKHPSGTPSPDLAGLCRAFQAITGTKTPGTPGTPGNPGTPGTPAKPGTHGKAHKAVKKVEKAGQKVAKQADKTGKAAKDVQGKALQNPAFSYLIKVAGGPDKVTAFCAQLAKTHPGTPAPVTPTPGVPNVTPPAGLPAKHPKLPKHTPVPSKVPTPRLSVPSNGHGH